MVVYMKKILFSLLLGLFVITPLGVGLSATSSEFMIHNAAVQYGQKRPFSFYYPYNYKYYYPRPEYHRTSQACYWLYTNGTYVYYCN